MACDITSGFTLGCRDNTGGLKNIYILSGSIDSTSGATGLLDEVSGSGIFYKFELTRQTGDFTEAINANVENGTIFYEQTVNAPFHLTVSYKFYYEFNPLVIISLIRIFTDMILLKPNECGYRSFRSGRI